MQFCKQGDDLICTNVGHVAHGKVFKTHTESLEAFNSLFGKGMISNVYAESVIDTTTTNIEDCIDFSGRLILEMSSGKFVGFVGYGSGGYEGTEMFSVQVNS